MGVRERNKRSKTYRVDDVADETDQTETRDTERDGVQTARVIREQVLDPLQILAADVVFNSGGQHQAHNQQNQEYHCQNQMSILNNAGRMVEMPIQIVNTVYFRALHTR